MLNSSITAKLVFATLSLFFFIHSSVAGPHGGGHSWCYLDSSCGPTHWEGKCKTGKVQSPVDFNSDNVKENKTQIRLRFNENYFDVQQMFYVKNNGHTVQIQLTEDLSSKLIMDGDGLKGAYVFSQFHFHWGSKDDKGSEHTVGGKAYPLELHLVHYNDEYKGLGDAVGSKNHRALAVLGIFFELSDKDNIALKPIIDAIPGSRKVQEDASIVNQALNVSAFFPNDLSLYRYYGSLTTPSCFEIVHWNVFKKPVPISETQLQAFRSLQDDQGHSLVDNFRPTLPLAGRKVNEYEAVEMEIKPESATIDSRKPAPDTDYDEALIILETPDSNAIDEKKNGVGIPTTNYLLLGLSLIGVVSLRLK